MQKTLVSVTTGSVLCLCLAALAGQTVAQGGGERAMELLDAVATARGLGSTPIKDGGGDPPIADDDGDGVANDSDSCPNTPAGEAVDGEGCSASQRDDDADGVVNGADLCPDTPAGESVDSDGCSQSQLDSEAAVRQVYGDDVNPLIVSAQGGCTGSGCHGRAGAPGGLRLYGAGEDNSTQRNYDSFTSYIGRESAERLLSKLSGGLGHGGGTRYGVDTAEYNTIAAWAESVEALP